MQKHLKMDTIFSDKFEVKIIDTIVVTLATGTRDAIN